MTDCYLHPLMIGSVRLPNNLALAPMAGTSDLAFRRLCQRMGAGLTVTELVSARGIVHDPLLRRNWRYLAIDGADGPAAIQLFGHEPDDFVQAIDRILSHPQLGQCAMIDINMGCPVAKVVKSGAGAALMCDLELAGRVVAASVRTAERFNKPVTVKCRKGWDADHVNAVSLARSAEAAGASALTVHGRTRDQFYSGRADWQIIADVRAAVSIPVFGNGDIDSPQAARRMLEQTGADGVMVGRAAQGNPWIFSWLSAGLEQPASIPQVTADEKITVILEHLDGLIGLYGEATAVREMRKQLAFYFKGTRHGAELKNRAMQAPTRSEVKVVLEDWRILCQNIVEKQNGSC